MHLTNTKKAEYWWSRAQTMETDNLNSGSYAFVYGMLSEKLFKTSLSINFAGNKMGIIKCILHYIWEN